MFLLRRILTKCTRSSTQLKCSNRCLSEMQKQRYLGALEQNMYHGRKLIPNMATLECTKKVEESHIVAALGSLITRHPMLRMCIQEDGNGPYFIESLDKKIDIHIYENADLYSVAQDQYIRHFENGSEVWRFSWVKNKTSNNCNMFHFVFSILHCASDFPYSYLIVLEFLESLVNVQNGSTSDFTHYSYQPACEQIPSLQHDSNTSKGSIHKPMLSARPALHAYNHYFRDEIKEQSTTKKLISPFEQIIVCSAILKSFLSACNEQKVSNTSAILALLTLSFSQLLRSKGCEEPIMYDFVTWANLRRYIDQNSEFFTGMAVVPIKISVAVNTQSNAENILWDLAKDINSQVRSSIDDKLPLKILHEVYPKLVKEGQKKGKSDNIFSLSNVGSVVGIKPEIQKNFTLKDYTVIADIDVDYSPIFLVVSYILNGSLYIRAFYTSTYTSRDTAKSFMSHVGETVETV